MMVFLSCQRKQYELELRGRNVPKGTMQVQIMEFGLSFIGNRKSLKLFEQSANMIRTRTVNLDAVGEIGCKEVERKEVRAIRMLLLQSRRELIRAQQG